jgi:PIN domain nuclease of toxin-antitoxin system
MGKAPPPLLLDTHVWVNYLNGSPVLRQTTVRAIEEARSSGDVFVSVISIWEIALLVRLKRLALHTSVSDWVNQALLLPGINLLSFSQQIAIDAVDIPDPMHKDPCDRILVASARVERLTLVTRDGDILDFAKATHLAVMKA